MAKNKSNRKKNTEFPKSLFLTSASSFLKRFSSETNASFFSLSTSCDSFVNDICQVTSSPNLYLTEAAHEKRNQDSACLVVTVVGL